MAALVRLYRTPCSLCFRLLQRGIVNTRGKYTNIFPRGIAYSASKFVDEPSDADGCALATLVLNDSFD